MQNPSLARKAGVVGMVAAGLWIASVIMQNSLGLFNPDGSPLRIAHQLLAMTALAGMVVGFLGLIWGGAVQSRVGKAGVYLYAAGWGLIIVAGLAGLLLQGQDSPLFVLYPLAGLLYDLGGLVAGIAVLTAKRWTGWQRFMPLVSFLVIFFGVNLPVFLGATDGPSMLGEVIMGACWFGVALAVYTTQAKGATLPSSPVAGQV